jgi:hypothetical protein
VDESPPHESNAATEKAERIQVEIDRRDGNIRALSCGENPTHEAGQHHNEPPPVRESGLFGRGCKRCAIDWWRRRRAQGDVVERQDAATLASHQLVTVSCHRSVTWEICAPRPFRHSRRHSR